jgi:hypothetical protein
MLTIRVPIAPFFMRKESSIAPIKSLSSASPAIVVPLLDRHQSRSETL